MPKSKQKYERFDIEDSTEVTVKSKRKISVLTKTLFGLLTILAVAALSIAVIVPTVLLTASKSKSSTTSIQQLFPHVTSGATLNIEKIDTTVSVVATKKETTIDASSSAIYTTADMIPTTTKTTIVHSTAIGTTAYMISTTTRTTMTPSTAIDTTVDMISTITKTTMTPPTAIDTTVHIISTAIETTVDSSTAIDTTVDMISTAIETTMTPSTTEEATTSGSFTETSSEESVSSTYTTTGRVMETTTVCPLDHAPTSSGTCVNIMTDFINCGFVGFVCSANYTACLGGSCTIEPVVPLSGATAIPGWLNLDTDDTFTPVSLPFSITLYDYSTTQVQVTTNGVVCLGRCSNEYNNGPLPFRDFIDPTAFGFWDDLKIFKNKSHAVYYTEKETAPNRRMIFEFYESHYKLASESYRFQIIFYENLPNIVRYAYFEITYRGATTATIGVQKSATGPSITHSVDRPNAVRNGTSIIFDTKSGTFYEWF